MRFHVTRKRVKNLIVLGVFYPMSLDLALQGLLPLIVFAVVDIFASMNVAIAAAMVVGILEILWSWYSFNEVDQTSWISLGLIVVMGLISIRMHSDKLFKLQPVAMGLVFAATLAWFQWAGNPLMVQMMPKVARLLPEENQWVLHDPLMLKRMARLDLMFVGAFLAHAALVAWTALRKPTMHWLIARAAGFYAIAAIVLFINFLLPLK
jgi:intracellular septation protein A